MNRKADADGLKIPTRKDLWMYSLPVLIHVNHTHTHTYTHTYYVAGLFVISYTQEIGISVPFT